LRLLFTPAREVEERVHEGIILGEHEGPGGKRIEGVSEDGVTYASITT
jgi:hypothetical protein